MILNPVQLTVLRALANSADGTLTPAQVKGIYPKTEKKSNISGLHVNTLVRRNLAEWIRADHDPAGRAIALRITETGRGAIAVAEAVS